MRIPADAAATLVAVLDEGGMEAAASRLHITPSAVSQRIKALEEQVGRVLLVRARPVRPTAAALPIIRYARQTALLEQEALAQLGNDAGGYTSIPLAVNADSLATWLLAPLARLSARHPVVFDLHRDDQDHTAALLEAGTVLGAITSRHTPIAGCRVTPLGMLRYEAVAAPAVVAEWFADGVTTSALEAAPIVDFDRRDDLQTRWLVAHGADAQHPPRHRIPASQDFAAAVLLGLGWALLPRLQSQQALDDGRLVPLGGQPVDVALYWQQWNLRSDLLDEISDEVVGEARRVLAM